MKVIELTGAFIEPEKQQISICGEDLTDLFQGSCAAIPKDIGELEIIAIANIDEDFKKLSISVESEGLKNAER